MTTVETPKAYTQDDIDDLTDEIRRLKEELEIAEENYAEAENKRAELDAELYELRQAPSEWSATIEDVSPVRCGLRVSIIVNATPGEALRLRYGNRVYVGLEQ